MTSLKVCRVLSRASCPEYSQVPRWADRISGHKLAGNVLRFAPNVWLSFQLYLPVSQSPSPPHRFRLTYLRELWKCLTGPFWGEMENANEMQPNIFPPRRLSYFYVFLWQLYLLASAPPPTAPFPLLHFSKTKAAWPQENNPPTQLQPARQLVQPLPRHLRQTNKSSHLFDFTQSEG